MTITKPVPAPTGPSHNPQLMSVTLRDLAALVFICTHKFNDAASAFQSADNFIKARNAPSKSDG